MSLSSPPAASSRFRAMVDDEAVGDVRSAEAAGPCFCLGFFSILQPNESLGHARRCRCIPQGEEIVIHERDSKQYRFLNR
jgi:hypothetical protein